MPASESYTVVIFLAACVGLMLLVLLLVFRILSRLTSIERRMAADGSSLDGLGQTPSMAETSKGGAFETFLKEDPSRRDLSKNEQFATYRRWRQENGLNWTNK
jgi:hypothetical protein